LDRPTARRLITCTTAAPTKNPARAAPTRPTRISVQVHVAATGCAGVVDDTDRLALPSAVSPTASTISTTIEYVPEVEGAHVQSEALVETHPSGRPRYAYENGPTPPASVTLIVTVCPAVTTAGETVNC